MKNWEVVENDNLNLKMLHISHSIKIIKYFIKHSFNKFSMQVIDRSTSVSSSMQIEKDLFMCIMSIIKMKVLLPSISL